MKTVCTECGVIDRHLGKTDLSTGDFILHCQSCSNEWVAMTAKEQQDEAESRMSEANEVLNPVLRKFLKTKL